MKVTLENINSLDGSEITKYYDDNQLDITRILEKLNKLSFSCSQNNEGLVFDTLLCEINLRIQQLETLPNCVKINGRVYLVGNNKNDGGDFGDLTELFDMTTEIETNGRECYSFYISCDAKLFPQATDSEKIIVRNFLKL